MNFIVIFLNNFKIILDFVDFDTLLLNFIMICLYWTQFYIPRRLFGEGFNM